MTKRAHIIQRAWFPALGVAGLALVAACEEAEEPELYEAEPVEQEPIGQVGEEPFQQEPYEEEVALGEAEPFEQEPYEQEPFEQEPYEEQAALGEEEPIEEPVGEAMEPEEEVAVAPGAGEPGEEAELMPEGKTMAPEEEVAVAPGAMEQPGMQAQAEQPRDIQGTVEQIFFDQGFAIVDTQEGLVAVHADPSALVALDEGTSASMKVVSHEGQLWAQRDSISGARDWAPFAIEQEPMEADLDQEAFTTGRLQVGDRTFMLNPEDLEGMDPGTEVSLRYVELGDMSWVVDVQPAGRVAAGEVEDFE